MTLLALLKGGIRFLSQPTAQGILARNWSRSARYAPRQPQRGQSTGWHRQCFGERGEGRTQAACCRYRWPCESSPRGASVRLGSALAAWSSSEALARASARARLPRRRARCQSRPSIPRRKVRDCVQHPGSHCATGATLPRLHLHFLPPLHVAHALHVHHAEHHVRD